MYRFLDTGKNNGAMNMAIDEALLIEQAELKTPPVIRVYQFDPPTLSIGYFQNIKREVNIDYCKKRGFDIVRRPTGGRAVLHDKELTYSITIAHPHKILDMNLLDSFRFLSGGIIEGIKLIGCNAYFSRVEDKEINSSSCFAAPTLSDILINGKKVVGSAQMRNSLGLLQHGSILYSVSIGDIFNALKIEENKRKEIIEEAAQKITSLSDESGRKISFLEVCESFKNGMKKVLQDEILEDSLTEKEIKKSKELYEVKYNTYEWNFKR